MAGATDGFQKGIGLLNVFQQMQSAQALREMRQASIEQRNQTLELKRQQARYNAHKLELNRVTIGLSMLDKLNPQQQDGVLRNAYSAVGLEPPPQFTSEDSQYLQGAVLNTLGAMQGAETTGQAELLKRALLSNPRFTSTQEGKRQLSLYAPLLAEGAEQPEKTALSTLATGTVFSDEQRAALQNLPAETIRKIVTDPDQMKMHALLNVLQTDARRRGGDPTVTPSEVQQAAVVGRAFGYNLTDPAMQGIIKNFDTQQDYQKFGAQLAETRQSVRNVKDLVKDEIPKMIVAEAQVQAGLGEIAKTEGKSGVGVAAQGRRKQIASSMRRRLSQLDPNYDQRVSDLKKRIQVIQDALEAIPSHINELKTNPQYANTGLAPSLLLSAQREQEQLQLQLRAFKAQHALLTGESLSLKELNGVERDLNDTMKRYEASRQASIKESDRIAREDLEQRKTAHVRKTAETDATNELQSHVNDLLASDKSLATNRSKLSKKLAPFIDEISKKYKVRPDIDEALKVLDAPRGAKTDSPLEIQKALRSDIEGHIRVAASITGQSGIEIGGEGNSIVIGSKTDLEALGSEVEKRVRAEMEHGVGDKRVHNVLLNLARQWQNGKRTAVISELNPEEKKQQDKVTADKLRDVLRGK